MSALSFEIIESNDGLLAKRARVQGGWLYLFQELDYADRQQPIVATSCFVPDTKTGGMTADDLHALRGHP